MGSLFYRAAEVTHMSSNTDNVNTVGDWKKKTDAIAIVII